MTRYGVDTLELARARRRARAELIGKETTPVRVGRFEIRALIGSGGFGMVWEAWDPTLGRSVAVKRLKHASADRAGEIRREARAVAQVRDPGTVAIFEIIEDEQEGVFVAFEHIQGPPLDVWLGSDPKASEIDRVFMDLARALSAVHASGLVHGDIKPQNVIVTDGLRTKLLDFGLAREIGEQGGVVAGTPQFMAPELVGGGDTTPATDQFALCRAWLDARGVVEPRLPRRLRRVLQRGVRVEPERRWPSIDALIRVASRSRTPVVFGVAAAALALGLGAWAMASAGPVPGCEAQDDRLARVYGAGAAASLRARIEGQGEPKSAALVVRSLDLYASRWLNAKQGLCESLRGSEVGAEAFSRRSLCLERRLADLRATVEVVSELSQVEVNDAASVVANLPTIEGCDGVDEEGGPWLPADPARAVRARELDARLARASVLLHVGRLAQSSAILDEDEPAMLELGHPPSTAHSAQLRGMLASRRGEFEEAEAHFIRANMLALEHRLDGLAAESSVHLMDLVISKLEEPARGERWQRQADALTRDSPNASQRVSYLWALAQVEVKKGNLDHAWVLATEAESILASRFPEAEYPLARMRVFLGGLATRRGDERAASILEANHERLVEVLGASHPMVALNAVNRGFAASREGRDDEARAHNLGALEILQRQDGMDAELARLLTNLGALEGRAENPQLAERYYRQALDLRQRSLGEQHPLVAESKVNLGAALVDREQYREAQTLITEAMVSLRASRGAEHPSIGVLLVNLGEAQLELGRPEAEGTYREALRVLERTEGTERGTAFARVGLGRALVAQGRDAEAIPALEAAVEATDRHGDVAEATLARVALLEALRRRGDADAVLDRLRAAALSGCDALHGGKAEACMRAAGGS